MITLQKIADTIKSKNKFWIAFVGDSLTSTEWVHPNWREIVEYVLKDKLENYFNGDWKPSAWGIRCFNFGYDGARTSDILERVEDIKMVEPDLVIGLMGGNDPVFDLSIDDHIGNIEKIISLLSSKIVWCTSLPALDNTNKNLKYEPYSVAAMKIVKDEDVQLIDMFNIYKQFPLGKFFTFRSGEEIPEENVKEEDLDRQHPNQLGNAYVAKVILKEVFGIEFDPEKYIKDTLKGEKFPEY